MKIINANFEIVDRLDGNDILKKIERCGRVCYKSEDKITNESAKKFVTFIIEHGHESVLEHVSFTVKFIVDRGISHEIVRHRIASYSQESTRYCNYKNNNEIIVIEPCFWNETEPPYGEEKAHYNAWKKSCEIAESTYLKMIEHGALPQEARSVLPNSLKTEVIMTANLREWRHFFRLRTAKNAHPQMREVACSLLKAIKNIIPIVFNNIQV